jgi:tRNA A-37 threonylcarbamoyl transferase component Bud32
MDSLRGHLDPDVESALPDGLRGLLAARPSAHLRAVPGRETFAWPEVVYPTLVVKRYRGDLNRDRWYDRLRGRLPRSPGRREYENLVALAQDGLPVPQALGWAEAPGDVSLVVMARVPHGDHLRDRLLGGEPPGPWIRRLAPLVVLLHDRGWYHRDLYLQHWVEGPTGPVLLDVGRARREGAPRRRWFVKDLAALHHSAPAAVGPAARLRFLARYLDGRGVRDRQERRSWARQVAARAARMTAHVPRHGSPEVSA